MSDGTFLLDGGAMFGVVPRAVWEKSAPPDALGRIRLALRCLLVEVDDRKILVDTGIGTDWDERSVERFGIDHHSDELLRGLAAKGLSEEDITDVVLTHLHFDHAGGILTRRADAPPRLTFPKARHHLQRRNLAHALRPTQRDRGSYLADKFSLLAQSSLLRLLDGPQEIAPGVDVLIFEGHTVGQQLVRVRDPVPGGGWLLFAADIIPTKAHLAPAFVMGYDLMPDVTAREKSRVLVRAARENALIVFEHDPEIAACRAHLDDKGRPCASDELRAL